MLDRFDLHPLLCKLLIRQFREGYMFQTKIDYQR